jgi:hypothetical protein
MSRIMVVVEDLLVGGNPSGLGLRVGWMEDGGKIGEGFSFLNTF